MSDKFEADQDELRLFVSSTLIAIMAGVNDAQSAARAPAANNSGQLGFIGPDQVTFDVAVHAKKSGKLGGGLKVEVFSIGANAEKGTTREDATVSRISFSIPTAYRSS